MQTRGSSRCARYAKRVGLRQRRSMVPDQVRFRGEAFASVRVGWLRVLSAAFVVAVLLGAPTASAFAVSGFDPAILSATRFAAKQVTATEKKLPAWTYTYYTSGSQWLTWGPSGWTSGYLPGELWSLYSLTGDPWFRTHAASRQDPIHKVSIDASSTDIGIRYYYSYALGFEQTGNQRYSAHALKAAAGEAARFMPAVGVVRSRNTSGTCQVVIDELMNVQILYWGAEHGGPAAWRDIAHRHATTVARDFVRPDGSIYHVVDYDPATGAVEDVERGQGYSESSMWARGQGWAIHGFATAWRKTKDPEMLATARKVADRYLSDLPTDSVPYWDFADPNIPDSPRDSSAAAVAASGLLDLAVNDPDPANRARYESAARETLASLTSHAYLSTGTVPSVLLHGTMNYWTAGTRDVGQSFGDYFLLEALQRLRRLPSTSPALHVRRVRASKGKPAAAVDGKLSTAWVSRGKQWIEVDLGRARTVQSVTVAVRWGQSRSATLKMYTSRDRKHWTLVSRARSSGETASAETYAFKPVAARYVRLACSGTSVNKVNGISELAVR